MTSEVQKPIDIGVQIKLKKEDSFNVIRETLTRMGIASIKENERPVLYQSAHIFHKRGLYYIVSFKELFKLDNRPAKITDEDYARRNTIAKLLESWDLLTIVDKTQVEKEVPQMLKLKIIKSDEKDEWDLKQKYAIGNSKFKKDE